jgi:hypothetical protein
MQMKKIGIAALIAAVTITLFQNCASGLPNIAADNAASKSGVSGAQATTSESSASCVASVQNNCTLGAQTSGNVGGTCATGYSGSCVATCNGGTWTMGSNSCTAIDPLAPCSGVLTLHVAGNTATLTINRSGTQISGPMVFPNYPNDTFSGTCTSTALGQGTVQFTRTTLTAGGYLYQVFTGTWTSTDFIHAHMTGEWSEFGTNQGPWDAETQ